MSKKLLSEAVVRRFAKLANLPVINEAGANKGDQGGTDYENYQGTDPNYKPKNRGDSHGDQGRKDYVPDEEQDERKLKREDGMSDIADEVADEDESLPMPDQDEMADIGGEEEEGGEMGMDLGSREELAMDVITAVADVLNIEVDIEGGEGEEVEDVEMTDVDIDDEGGDIEVDAEEEEFEDVLQEALRGINYVPGKKEIVNEVAKRVAKRLLKAKKAEQQLQEALGNRTRKTTRTTAKRRTRPTRNARRRTKK